MANALSSLFPSSLFAAIAKGCKPWEMWIQTIPYGTPPPAIWVVAAVVVVCCNCKPQPQRRHNRMPEGKEVGRHTSDEAMRVTKSSRTGPWPTWDTVRLDVSHEGREDGTPHTVWIVASLWLVNLVLLCWQWGRRKSLPWILDTRKRSSICTVKIFKKGRWVLSEQNWVANNDKHVIYDSVKFDCEVINQSFYQLSDGTQSSLD